MRQKIKKKEEVKGLKDGCTHRQKKNNHRTHLLTAEPKLSPTLFGRDRGTASVNWHSWYVAKVKKLKTTALSLFFSLFFPPCLLSAITVFTEACFHPPLPPSESCSLHTHTTLSLATPSLSSQVLFVHCNDDCKDTRIRWWGFGAQRRANPVQAGHKLIFYLFSRSIINFSVSWCFLCNIRIVTLFRSHSAPKRKTPVLALCKHQRPALNSGCHGRGEKTEEEFDGGSWEEKSERWGPYLPFVTQPAREIRWTL